MFQLLWEASLYLMTYLTRTSCSHQRVMLTEFGMTNESSFNLYVHVRIKLWLNNWSFWYLYASNSERLSDQYGKSWFSPVHTYEGTIFSNCDFLIYICALPCLRDESTLIYPYLSKPPRINTSSWRFFFSLIRLLPGWTFDSADNTYILYRSHANITSI